MVFLMIFWIEISRVFSMKWYYGKYVTKRRNKRVEELSQNSSNNWMLFKYSKTSVINVGVMNISIISVLFKI